MYKNQNGVTLVEVLVAVAIVGATTAIFLMGLTQTVDTTVITDEKSTALGIAEDQMEFIQSQPYDDVNNPPLYKHIDYGKPPGEGVVPPGWSIATPMVVRADPLNNGTATDDGLQRIQIEVMRSDGKILASVEGYKSVFYFHD